MNTQIPENVAVIISTKKQDIETEKRLKEEEAQIKRQAFIAEGERLLQARLAEIRTALPEWIRFYEVTASQYDDETLVRIGEGYSKLTSMNLSFEIPGLADIQFCSKDNSWRSAQARGSQYGDEKPYTGFYNDCYWRSDLEFVLVEAQEAQMRFIEYQKIYDARQERFKTEMEEQTVHEEINSLRDQERILNKLTEEQELFDVFKGDPVAIALMKAFLMVRQERDMFEQRITEADEVTYSIEERWTRKAEELRRQAKDAENQAEDERRRVSDLEDDLSKAKKQIKTQGW